MKLTLALSASLAMAGCQKYDIPPPTPEQVEYGIRISKKVLEWTLGS